jgi:hypothetical protein
VCNDQSAFGGGDFDPNNPFTPDIKVYNQNGRLIRNNRAADFYRNRPAASFMSPTKPANENTSQ